MAFRRDPVEAGCHRSETGDEGGQELRWLQDSQGIETRLTAPIPLVAMTEVRRSGRPHQAKREPGDIRSPRRCPGIDCRGWMVGSRERRQSGNAGNRPEVLRGKRIT